MALEDKKIEDRIDGNLDRGGGDRLGEGEKGLTDYDPIADLEALGGDVMRGEDDRLALREAGVSEPREASVVLEKVLYPGMLAEKDALVASGGPLKAAALARTNIIDTISNAALSFFGFNKSSAASLKNKETITEALGQERLIFIKYLSKTSGIPPAVIASIMYIESGGNPNYMSFGGAAGRFQHIASTARSTRRGGGREIVTHRNTEDGNNKMVKDGKVYFDETPGSPRYSIARHGDYKDSEGKYYPLEDGRFGFEHWAGTTNILYGNYKSAGDSWLNAPIYYHDAYGFNNNIYTYLAKPWGDHNSKLYAATFAYAVQGASDIDWDALPDYGSRHEVREVEEPISLYDLVTSDKNYSLLDFVDDSDPNASLNNQLSLFRLPLGALETDLRVPKVSKNSTGELNHVNHYFLARKRVGGKWVAYDELSVIDRLKGVDKRTGFYHQAKGGLQANDVYTDNGDGTVTVHKSAFKYTEADIAAWRGNGEFHNEETSTSPKFTYRRRGVFHPPTIDDLRRSGISFSEIIALNPNVFGVNGGTMDRAIERYLKTTYLRPGYLLEVKKGKAPSGTTQKKEKVKAPLTSEQKIEVRGIDAKVRRKVKGVIFSKVDPAEDFENLMWEYKLVGDDRYFAKKRDPWNHLKHPTADLLEVTARKYRRATQTSGTKELIEVIMDHPDLMEQWLNDYFHTNAQDIMTRQKKLSVEDIEFFMMTLKVYQRVIDSRKPSLLHSESFWDQYKQMIAWHGELVAIEEGKKGIQKEIDKAEEEQRPWDIPKIKEEKGFREKKELEKVQALLGEEAVIKEFESVEFKEFAYKAQKKVKEELEKFHAIGLRIGDGIMLPQTDDGEDLVDQVVIPIVITDNSAQGFKSQIGEAHFSMSTGTEKFDLYSMTSVGGPGNADEMYTERWDGESNEDLESIEAENVNDMLYEYVVYRLINTPDKKAESARASLEEGVAKYGKNGEYSLFTTEEDAKYYLVPIIPSGAEFTDYIGTLYIDVFETLEEDAEMDGNFITLSTKRWKIVDREVVREKNGKGERIPEIVMGRFSSVEGLIEAINKAGMIDGYVGGNTTDFMKRPELKKGDKE